MVSPEEALKKLIEVVAKLRDPNGGCPWDLEQTHESLKPYVIEEAFEVVEAIDFGGNKLKEELGDLLLQVALHSQIASENNSFNLSDVIQYITEKMIKRHPHVFGENKLGSSEEVLKNWEQNKQKELPKDVSILDGVPRTMPALLRALRIGDKAARVGFEWPNIEGVRDKVFEEMNEFLECSTNESSDMMKLEDELGDILFSLSQLARRLKFNSEELLHKACNKFTDRFKKMEKLAIRDLSEMSIDELDQLWNQVKSQR